MSETVTDGVQGGAALKTLQSAYDNRLAAARAHHDAGGMVVGHVGNGLPIEVIMATGFMPVSIAPLPDRPIIFAEEWTNAAFNPQLRVILDQMLSGELSFLEVAVHCSQFQQDSFVYHFAKEIVAKGHGITVPPLHHFSMLGHRYPSSAEYCTLQTEALARRLRGITGAHAATADTLAKAVDVTNRNRGLLAKLNVRRRTGEVSGVEALTVTGASRFMAPQAYGDALEGYLAARPASKPKGPKLLVMASSKLTDTQVHEAVEGAGCVVTADDDCWGSRAATPPIKLAANPLHEIAQHYHLNTPNRSVYPATTRLSWMYENGPADDIDGVVFYMPPSDRAMGWDYPRLKDFLDSKDKPSMVLRCDAATPEGRDLATSTTRYFIENSL